jgi:2-oxoglutarate ferredoxin oxidoreductase subunit gamma
MENGRINIQFCGFGGQGIILLAVLFGSTSVTRAGLNAVQTQSYGSEARGGECQAEVIVAKAPIDSPLADTMDVLVAMSQTALDKYIERLRLGGLLIYDPELIERVRRSDIRAHQVPATQIAGELGVKLAANMVMLGYLQPTLGLFSAADVFEVVRDNVPARFIDVNLKAVEKGIALAIERGARMGA